MQSDEQMIAAIKFAISSIEEDASKHFDFNRFLTAVLFSCAKDIAEGKDPFHAIFSYSMFHDAGEVQRFPGGDLNCQAVRNELRTSLQKTLATFYACVFRARIDQFELEPLEGSTLPKELEDLQQKMTLDAPREAIAFVADSADGEEFRALFPLRCTNNSREILFMKTLVGGEALWPLTGLLRVEECCQ